MFLSNYHGNKYFQIIIKYGVYMWTGTFNVTINEHLCKYNVTKYVLFIKKRLIYTIIIPI